jgi:translation initiation factor IF-2
MELKIIKNERNEAFGRSEIIAELRDKKIPSKKEIKKNLTARLNAEKEKVIIESIIKEFGKEKIIVKARKYDNIEKMKKIEKKYLLTRNEEKEEIKEGSEKAAPEAKAEEKPAEEKIEEKSEAPKEESKNEETTEDTSKEKPAEEKKEEVKEEKSEAKEEAPKEEKAEEKKENNKDKKE